MLFKQFRKQICEMYEYLYEKQNFHTPICVCALPDQSRYVQKAVQKRRRI